MFRIIAIDKKNGPVIVRDNVNDGEYALAILAGEFGMRDDQTVVIDCPSNPVMDTAVIIAGNGFDFDMTTNYLMNEYSLEEDVAAAMAGNAIDALVLKYA